MTEKDTTRNVGIDLIKILACCGVLGLHVYLQRLIVEPKFVPQNIFFYISTLSMPIFFMVNGYLIMRKVHDFTYYRRKITNMFKIVFTLNIFWYIFLLIKGNSYTDVQNPITATLFSMIGCLLVIQFLVNCGNHYCGYTGHTLLEQKIFQPFRLYNHLCYFLLGGMINYFDVIPGILKNCRAVLI